jgi:ubiquinone biosynthesis protein COQ9
MQIDPSAKRDDLVLAALPHIAFDGWSDVALSEAARDLDYPPREALRLFPGGATDALAHFVSLSDKMLIDDFALQGPRGGKLDERVFVAVKMRLDRWSAHREAIRRGVALLALPQNLPLAATLGWGTSDALWRAVGDKSHDLTWATKRGSLAALYSATLFYWLDDSSEDSIETWAFLRRRLLDMGKLPRLRHRVETAVRRSFTSFQRKSPWNRNRLNRRVAGGL